jgi:hypothetical protein
MQQLVLELVVRRAIAAAPTTPPVPMSANCLYALFNALVENKQFALCLVHL